MLTAFAIGFAKEILDYLIYSFNFVLYVLEKKNLCQTPDRVGIYKISPELILRDPGLHSKSPIASHLRCKLNSTLKIVDGKRHWPCFLYI